MDTGPEVCEKALERWIETSSGKRLPFINPVWDRDDCAASLSKQCRYTGHCRWFYSVAEHEILVSEIMEHLSLGDPYEGMHHDDTEYVLGDVNSPLKSLLPGYKKLEHHVDTAFRLQLGLPATITEGCKRADWLALFIEAAVLIPSKGKDWVAPPGVWEEAQTLVSRFWVRGWTPAMAEREWLARHKQLLARREA